MTKKPIAQAANKCLSMTGTPLFMLLRAVVDCEGSRVEHLVAGKRISYKRHRTTTFLTVLRRLLRDGPMPADQFRIAVNSAWLRYGPTEQGVRNAGYAFLAYPHSLIGDVRLSGKDFIYVSEPSIAKARDEEFARKKYKKMSNERVAFLKSLFELAALTKQISRK